MKKSMILLALAGMTASAMAQNGGALLTDGDAVWRHGSTSGAIWGTVNTSSTRPSIDLRVNGGTAGVDFGFDFNWYVGRNDRATDAVVANRREFSMGGVTGNFTRTITGNSVNYVIRNAFGITGLDANYTSTLWDNGLGANTAQVINTMTLTNNTGANLTDLDIFYSVDHDIAGAGSDIFDALLLSGGARVLVQRDNVSVGGPFAAALIGFGADASGAGSFSALNTQLTDSSVDFATLADLGSAGNTVTGDYAQMVQWRRSIDAGATVTVRADIVAGIGAGVVVPTPGAAALAGLGLLAAGRRRR